MSDRGTGSALRGIITVLRRKLLPWDPEWRPRAGEKRHIVVAEEGRERTARRAEEACARKLFWSGFRILARNVRCRYGELDIVARRGKVLLFVEVRSYREGSLRPIARLRRAKRLSLLRAADRFRARRPELRDLTPLIQVAEVCFDARGRILSIELVTVDYFHLRHTRG